MPPKTPHPPDAPLVSIVVPTLNSDQWLQATAASVLAQTAVRLEFIVMDGGSTDGTHAILTGLGERVTWRVQQDTGIAQAVNRGWALAQGEILAWIGSDDLYRPGAVAAAVVALQANPAAPAIYGDCDIIDAQGRTVGHIHPGPFSRTRLLGWNYLAQPSVFMRRAALAQAGWLDETLYNAMDHDLWIRLARLGALIYVPMTWAALRVHNRTTTNLQVIRAGEETLRVVQRALDAENAPPAVRAHALGEAHLRAAMCYYAASHLPPARVHLRQAVRHAPHLAADRRLLRTLVTSLLGARLIARLRRWRPGPHRAGVTETGGV